jgi:hypothetical protein
MVLSFLLLCTCYLSAQEVFGRSLFSIVLTYDRYLGESNSYFQPFIGGGLSHYKLDTDFEIREICAPGTLLSQKGEIKGQLGV